MFGVLLVQGSNNFRFIVPCDNSQAETFAIRAGGSKQPMTIEDIVADSMATDGQLGPGMQPGITKFCFEG